MIRLSSISLFFILISNVLLAQVNNETSTIKKSLPQKFHFKKGYFYREFSDGKDGHIVAEVLENYKEIHFTHYSNELKVVKENTLTPSLNPGILSIEFIATKNKLFMIWELNFKESKSESFMMQEFSPDDLNFIGTPFIVNTPSERIRSNPLYEDAYELVSSKFTMMDRHMYNLSPDRTKILTCYYLGNKESKDYRYGIAVVDENKNKIFAKEIVMPYDNDKMRTLNFHVTNDGTVYGLYKVYTGKDKRDKLDDAVTNYNFEIHSYSNNATKTYKIIPGQVLPINIGIISNDKNDLIFYGLYCSKNHKSTLSGNAGLKFIAGAFNVKIPQNSSQSEYTITQTSDLSAELISKNSPYASKESFRAISKGMKYTLGEGDRGADNEYGVDGLEIQNVFILSNGALSIITEKHKRNFQTFNIDVTNRLRKEYAANNFYGDIYVFYFNEKENANWNTKLPKAQIGSDYIATTNATTSLMSLANGNDVKLVYYDMPANKELGNNAAPKIYGDYKPGDLICKTIHSDGFITENFRTFMTNKNEYFLIDYKLQYATNPFSVNRVKWNEESYKIISMPIK